jgi:hypothetical protein
VADLSVAILANLVVAATVAVLRHGERLYLSADAGHYLADAAAVFGEGVRENRHLPVFPALVGVLRWVAGDFGAVLLGMAAVVVVLLVGFYALVRGRLGSPLAEAAGAAVFILAPVVAEGVAWYGASMLLGLGLALVAMRLVDEAIGDPSPRRVVAAGVACGLVGLTHPLPFALLAQVAAVVAVVALVRAGRGGRAGVRRLGLAVAGVAAVTAAVVAPALPFYTRLQAPVSVSFNPGRLATLPDWAFREDPRLWLPLLLAAAVVLVPGGRALGGERGLRLGLWGAAVAVVSVANLLLGGGHESYTTRYAYALPIAIGCGVAVVVALLLRPGAGGRPVGRAVVALVAVTVVAVVARTGDSYLRRLDVAIPYYNLLTEAEHEAIRWLAGREGTVAVSPKGGDKVAGTLYAWMIEGLADMRAIGTAEGFVNLLEEATVESLDVERLVAGSAVLESGRVRLSASEGTAAPIEIHGLVGGDWFPLVTLAVGPERVDPLPVASVDLSGIDDRGSMRVDYGSLEVRAAVYSDRADAEVAVDVVRVGQVDAVTMEVDPPPFAIGVALAAEGRRASVVRTVRDRRVEVELVAEGGARVTVEDDVRSGSARVHLEAGSRGLSVLVRVIGLDPHVAPVAVAADTEILDRRDVAYVYTWRVTGLPPVLAGRVCFREAMANDEVVVFEVLPACRRGGGGAVP